MPTNRSFGSRFIRCAVALILAASARPAFAGFAGTDTFVAAVARAPGQFSSQFYTTLLVTNTGAASAQISIKFYQRDQSNLSPATHNDTVAPGETKRYDNAVETLFGTTGAGAFRVVSSSDVLVSSRTYNLPASGRLEDSTGVFIGSVPANFAIGAGETTELQGVSQGGSENFRSNFGFIETAGQTATVAVKLKDAQGNEVATKTYIVLAAGQNQYGITDLYPQIATANSRLEVSVVGGGGKVIVYSTQAANGSNDSSAVEMAFKSSLIGPSSAKVTWNILFGTTGNNLDVSACNVSIPAGWCAQIVNVDSSGAFHEVWSVNEPNVLQVDGTLTATALSATLKCVATSATGSMSATASGSEYAGTATLSGKTLSIRVVKGSGSPSPPCS